MKNFCGYLGKSLNLSLRHLSSISSLFQQALYWVFIAPFKGKPVNRKYLSQQLELIGVKSVPIVAFVSFFFGITLAMLTAYQLQIFQAEVLVGALVGVSFTREIGSLLTGIVVAARVGAAMTAELGTMKVSEEIDALETMAIKPVRFLIAPRLLAILIMLPCLVIVANIMGILGGYLIGKLSLGIDTFYYFSQTFKAIEVKDIVTGLTKSVFFAVIIGMVGCYQGFIVAGGAEGVGKSTTTSVVTSIFLIIITDCVLNALFYFI